MVEPKHKYDFVEKVQNKDQIERLLAKLKEMNPTYQEILNLKYIAECTTEEIAEIMQISPNSVYVTIHRALNKLKTLI